MDPHPRLPRATIAVHAFIALFVVTELVLRLYVSIFQQHDPELGVRLMRLFSYFTIQSNLLVGVFSAAVALGAPVHKRGWRVLQLTSLVGIIVTGVVYVLVLASSDHNHGLSILTNAMLHYTMPPLATLAWLAIGPWPPRSWGDVAYGMVWPFAWVGYTLIAGAISKWYPYGFVNVVTHGYAKVAVNVLFIAIFAAALAGAINFVNGLRSRGSSRPERPRSLRR